VESRSATTICKLTLQISSVISPGTGRSYGGVETQWNEPLTEITLRLGEAFVISRPFLVQKYSHFCNQYKSRDSSVGIALGYGLDDRGCRVRFPAGAGNFSLHHRVQNGSEAHPASYPMGTRGYFPEGKAAGA
jgi:hypothetical protein